MTNVIRQLAISDRRRLRKAKKHRRFIFERILPDGGWVVITDYRNEHDLHGLLSDMIGSRNWKFSDITVTEGLFNGRPVEVIQFSDELQFLLPKKLEDWERAVLLSNNRDNLLSKLKESLESLSCEAL